MRERAVGDGPAPLGPGFAPWLAELAELDPDPPARTAGDLADLLGPLGIEPADRPELLATFPDPDRDPYRFDLLARCRARLLRDLGHPDRPVGAYPNLPADWGAAGRCFWAHVYLATAEDVRRWHAARGVPADVSLATLADLGRHLRIDRDGDRTRLTHQRWLTAHWRGGLYQLGRLQFDRVTLREPAGPLADAGDPVLDVHIPAAGPLDPAACDASFALAREFFGTVFPATGRRVALCTSWLLDDQLAEYLPETSNIVRFGRRFTLLPGGRDADADIVWFTFRREPWDPAHLDDLPTRTALERAVVRHLTDGRHWRLRRGWVAL